MSNLYQTTTESIESLSAWPNCALPPLPCKKRKGMDQGRGKQQSDEDAQQGSSGESSRNGRGSGHRYVMLNFLYVLGISRFPF